MVTFIFFIAGCIVTLFISHLYYQRSINQIPKWADEFVKKLPKNQPEPRELLRLFQESLDSGEVEVNPVINRVICPECGESAKNFISSGGSVEDLGVEVAAFTCPTCGWSDYKEI
jgi:predicted RNA-binding Zn-ribbon protein involved in translation (DUF1610 family)